MRITQVHVVSTKIPVIRAHEMNIGTTRHQELVVVRVFTDEGIVGIGEAPHMVGHSQAGETPWTVRVVLRDKLIPAILAKDPMNIQGIQEAMDLAVPGNERAKSSINLAMYDIAGKALNTPVYNLLGGKYRSAVPLSWSLPIGEVDEIVREAERMCERGWRILKLKTGRRSLEHDIEAVKRVRQAVGKDVRIRADANQAYDVRGGIKVTNAMAEWGLEYMEQPVAGWDLEGMAQVRARASVPIMADESIKSVRAAYDVARMKAADYFSIYVCSPGGLINSKKIAVLGEAAGISGYVGGALESIIGSSAGLHLAASSSGISLGCEMGSQYLLADDIGTEPLEMKDGALVVPDGPGLGVTIDDKKIAKYMVGQAEQFEA